MLPSALPTVKQLHDSGRALGCAHTVTTPSETFRSSGADGEVTIYLWIRRKRTTYNALDLRSPAVAGSEDSPYDGWGSEWATAVVEGHARSAGGLAAAEQRHSSIGVN